MKIRERSLPISHETGGDDPTGHARIQPLVTRCLALCALAVGVSICLLAGAHAREPDVHPIPGLYKDGRKVLEITEVTSIPIEGRERVPTTLRTAAQAFYRDAFPDRRPGLFREQRDYVDAVVRCRDLARMILLAPGTGSDRDARINELLTLEEGVAAAGQALLDRFDSIERMLSDAGCPADKLRRHSEVTERHRLEVARILDLLSEVRAAHTASDLSGSVGATRDLDRYLADRVFVREPPLAEPAPLPLRMRVEEAATVSETAFRPEGAPSYPIIPRGERGYDPADLEETIDVQFTDEIIALADSLDHSPARIFDFVRENSEFEAYLGSRKGSQQTLEHRSGNDYDQASLLIALLRVSGIPARYATGEIKMPIDRATNWLGVRNKHNAGSLLATAGMDAVLYISGPDTVALGCQRVWVEGWVPFINYRGAVGDSIGATWIPMDPAFKQYAYDEGVNHPAAIGFDGGAFVDDYISTFHAETPVAMFRQMLLDGSGLPYEDLVTTRSVVRESDGILPGTLPHEVIRYDGSFSEISTNKRFRIRFHVYGEGTDLDYSTTIPEIAQKQVTISYVGATPADQQIIDDAGGIFNVSTPYLVDLKPVLMIDGCEVARGTGQVMMGLTHYFDMHFTTPEGDFNEVPLVSNYILAGNYLGIGIDTEDAFPAYFDAPETSCEEGILGREVHQTAFAYLNNVDIAADELADLLHQVVMNDVAEAIVEQTVTVLFSGELPVAFDWNGMIVDADRRIVGPFSVDGVDNSCDYMRVAGADASIQENRIWETRFEVEAISTIKILELAADSLINVCEITSSIPADCPWIDQPSHVIDAINNALAQGHHVIIPERQFTYYNWTGTGWIDLDPTTCAAGYIISGGQGGGATVEDWSEELEDLLTDETVCIRPEGPAGHEDEVQVSPDPDGGDNLYGAGNTAHWAFTVAKIIGFNEDCEQTSILTDQTYTVGKTIKELAEDPGFGPGEYVFRVGSLTDPHACGCRLLEKTVVIVNVDLSADDLSGTVGKLSEESPGAFVHWNLDNDNDSDNSVGAPKRSGADYLEVGTARVTGEDDLKPATMLLEPALTEGSVVLNVGGGKAKIWKHPEKGSANLIVAGAGQKTWNLANGAERTDFLNLCSKLQVEGVEDGACQVTLTFKDASGTVVCSDAVNYTFIAADCGRQPKTDAPDERTGYKNAFQKLVHTEWSITAESTGTYNCIAWSVGETGTWYNPQDIDRLYGDNDGVFENADMDKFYLDKMGWQPTASGAADAEAMYYPYPTNWDYRAHPYSPPSPGYHGAKKKACSCGNGQWVMFESKCGNWGRIEHVWDQLNDSGYGSPGRFYK